MSQERSSQIQLWIAIIAGLATIVAALITVLPQILPRNANDQVDTVQKTSSAFNPTAIPLTIQTDVPPGAVPTLEAQIKAVLDKAYQLKASSLKTLDSSQLTEAYTGDALKYRISTVDLAKSQNCTWDVRLEQPDQDVFTYISAETIRVQVLRVETRFHYCNGNLDASATANSDRYLTDYTLVKQGSAWLVSETDTTDLPDK